MPPRIDARRRLLDAALPRIAAHGGAALTLDDVRRDAGASVGALYHHFPDKQALLAAAVDEVQAAYHRAFLQELGRHAAPRAGVRAMVRFHVAWCTAHLEGARLLLERRPPSAEALDRPFFVGVADWWRPHAEAGTVRDLRPLVAYALWFGPVFQATLAWLAGDARRPTRAETTLFADAAWEAVRGRERPS